MRSLPQLGSMENKMVGGSSLRHLVTEIRYFFFQYTKGRTLETLIKQRKTSLNTDQGIN